MKTNQYYLLMGALACFAAHDRQLTTAAAQFNPTNFVDRVDNKFFPLAPGTTYHYEGEKDGVPSSDDFIVTHQTEQIAGVNCIVVRDRAYENGVLVEDTIDWFAQDKNGNVWYFGEDTKELDANGNVISTEGTWRAGTNGAEPGIIMEANPRVGDRCQQEFATGVAQDMARVASVNKAVTVAYGSFDDVLVTRESSPLDPGTVEQKYYAEGVGFILGVTIKGGNERTELVKITRNNPD